MAVGRRGLDLFGRDGTRGTGLVLDHHRLAGRLRDALAIGARDRAYFRKVLDEEGPVVLEVIKGLNIEPT